MTCTHLYEYIRSCEINIGKHVAVTVIHACIITTCYLGSWWKQIVLWNMTNCNNTTCKNAFFKNKIVFNELVFCKQMKKISVKIKIKREKREFPPDTYISLIKNPAVRSNFHLQYFLVVKNNYKLIFCLNFPNSFIC